VICTNGEITAIPLQYLNKAHWSTHPNHTPEAIYNYASHPTREMKHRIARLLDQVILCWAKTIPQVPNLKVKYSQNILSGYYKFSESECNLAINYFNETNQGIDTVD
jgi:hypothetical protein